MRKDEPVRRRKRDKQYANAQYDPGLVRVPEWSNSFDHLVLIIIARERQQNADAEVVAV